RFQRQYKLVVVGAGGACIFSSVMRSVQFVQNRFVVEYDPTIEDSYPKQYVIGDEVALLDLLNTGGLPEYEPLRDLYMATAEGFLLVYFITYREALEEITTLYKQILRVKNQDSFPVVIVANKCDLEYERQIGKAEGRTHATHLGCKFIETSARDYINVEEAFTTLVQEIRRVNPE
ncbi:small GTPase superfamily, partial [Mycena polygramma]